MGCHGRVTHPRVLAQSFGYVHGDPPPAAVVLDVRGWIPLDPAVAGWCQPLTGKDGRVRAAVTGSPYFALLLGHLYGLAAAALAACPDRQVVVAVGCSGGRHRSVVLADELAAVFRRLDVTAEARHIHLHRAPHQEERPCLAPK